MEVMKDASSGAGVPELLLLTRPGCHLCQGAREVLDRVSADLGVPWQERSIADDPELQERFAEEIPVLMIDGVQRDFWQIDEARLRRLLAK
ncbi:MAG: NrdH-redoxin [Arthrobacter koreensis]|nr:NrdH-redoxin [Arthrobacter koreensis]